jgi:glycoside hydrolase-like protein
MHRAVMAVIVSGCAVCGIAAGVHQGYALTLRPAVAVEVRASGGQDRPMVGFDTCRTPPLRTMRVWRARFSAAGIYIGGENRACDRGYLSRAWVRAVTVMGWSLLPSYVGPQPPCDPYPVRIRIRQAAAQGRASARDAIADATMLGIGRGSPVYYDMEDYNRAQRRCAIAVLAFLDAWTRQLNASGYLSGVYSSANAAVAGLRSTSRVDGHRLAKPQCLWIALWDDQKNMNAPGYLGRSSWPPGERSKQYAGPHWVKVGRIKMDIDSDLIDGPVVSDRHPARKRHRPHPRRAAEARGRRSALVRWTIVDYCEHRFYS